MVGERARWSVRAAESGLEPEFVPDEGPVRAGVGNQAASRLLAGQSCPLHPELPLVSAQVPEDVSGEVGTGVPAGAAGAASASGPGGGRWAGKDTIGPMDPDSPALRPENELRWFTKEDGAAVILPAGVTSPALLHPVDRELTTQALVDARREAFEAQFRVQRELEAAAGGGSVTGSACYQVARRFTSASSELPVMVAHLCESAEAAAVMVLARRARVARGAAIAAYPSPRHPGPAGPMGQVPTVAANSPMVPDRAADEPAQPQPAIRTLAVGADPARGEPPSGAGPGHGEAPERLPDQPVAMAGGRPSRRRGGGAGPPLTAIPPEPVDAERRADEPDPAPTPKQAADAAPTTWVPRQHRDALTPEQAQRAGRLLSDLEERHVSPLRDELRAQLSDLAREPVAATRAAAIDRELADWEARWFSWRQVLDLKDTSVGLRTLNPEQQELAEWILRNTGGLYRPGAGPGEALLRTLDRLEIPGVRDVIIDRFLTATQRRMADDRPKPNATVRDLRGLRPGNAQHPDQQEVARARTDQDLLDSVFLPYDGEYLSVIGREVVQGNHRRVELLRRARESQNAQRGGREPTSTISYDTPIYIQRFGR